MGSAVLLGILSGGILSMGASSPPAVGTITSHDPVTINGTRSIPSAAPSWPLADGDEIVNEGAALLRTPDRDSITLDPGSKARVSDAANRRTYIYVREGGIEFNARGGPLYVCIAGQLFIPEKSAQGSLRLNRAGSPVGRLERGAFAEAGARSCSPEIPPGFVASLPAIAGGTATAAAGGVAGAAGGVAGATASAAGIGAGAAAGGVTAGAVAGAAVGVGAAAAASAATLAGTSSCASPAGCNFNPTAISPVQP